MITVLPSISIVRWDSRRLLDKGDNVAKIKYDYLNKLLIRKKVRYLSPKDNRIKPATRGAIKDYLEEAGVKVVFPKDWDWEFTTKQGVFTKRLSKLVYKKYNTSLPPEVLAKLGLMAREGSMGKPKEYIFDVTDTINWRKGAFKDHSCFWGGYSKLPKRGTFELNALMRSGALALRFFQGISFIRRGLGRSWIWESGPYIHLFNAYGLPGNTQAGVLAGYLGLSHKRINGRSNLYLNNDYIYVIGTEADLAKAPDGTEYGGYDQWGYPIYKKIRMSFR